MYSLYTFESSAMAGSSVAHTESLCARRLLFSRSTFAAASGYATKLHQRPPESRNHNRRDNRRHVNGVPRNIALE